jgi:predicted permease
MKHTLVLLAVVFGHVAAIALPLALLWHDKATPGWAFIFMITGLTLMPTATVRGDGKKEDKS